jgi:ABC-type multidrug transport system ATPase subunit
MRAITDILGLTTIASLYQASNGIYEQFDKILILDGGRQIFYRPRDKAMLYIEDLSFLYDSTANKSDFLTSVSAPAVRTITPNFENRFPRSTEELLAAYNNSPIKLRIITELDYPNSPEAQQNTADFKEQEAQDKHKKLPKKAAESAGYFH